MVTPKVGQMTRKHAIIGRIMFGLFSYIMALKKRDFNIFKTVSLKLKQLVRFLSSGIDISCFCVKKAQCIQEIRVLHTGTHITDTQHYI